MMGVLAYIKIAVGVIVVLQGAAIFVMGKLIGKHKKDAQDASERAERAEAGKLKAQQEIKDLLEFQENDREIKEKIDYHVNVISKLKGKKETKDEIKNLFSDLGSIYSTR